MIKTVGQDGNGLRVTWYLFLELCFEYFLEFSEIFIAATVVFFGILGGGIEAEMTGTRLKSSSDE